MTWTPPSDAESVEFTPPSDAEVVDDKKKVQSPDFSTGLENTTQSTSTSTSEIPEVTLDEQGNITPVEQGNLISSPTPFGVNDHISLRNKARTTALKKRVDEDFLSNQQLYSNPRNRAIYYKTLYDNGVSPESIAEIIGDNPDDINSFADKLHGEDYWKMKSRYLTTDERVNPDKYKQIVSDAISNTVEPTGGLATGAIKAAAHGIKAGAEKLAQSNMVAQKEGIVSGALNQLVGTGEMVMGAMNLVSPELAAFSIGTEEAEKKAPGISNVLAPASYFIQKHYQDKGEPVPTWANNAGVVTDFLAQLGVAAGLHKGTVKEILDSAPKKTVDDVLQMFSEREKEPTQRKSMPYEDDTIDLHKKIQDMEKDMKSVAGTPAEESVAASFGDINDQLMEMHDNAAAEVADKARLQTEKVDAIDVIDNQIKALEEAKKNPDLSEESKAAIERDQKVAESHKSELERETEDPHKDIKSIADLYNSIPSEAHRKNPSYANGILGKLKEEAEKIPGMEVKIRPSRGRNKVELLHDGKKINSLNITTQGAKQRALTSEELGAARMVEPKNIRDAVLQYFIDGGKISGEDFSKEVHPSNSTEYKKALWLRGKHDTYRNTIDRIVMRIADSMGKDYRDDSFATEARNEIIDVLSSHEGKKTMYDELMSHDEIGQKDVHDQEAAARRDYYLEELGISPEDAKHLTDEQIIMDYLDKANKEENDAWNSIENDDLVVKDIYDKYGDENGNIDYNKLADDISSGAYPLPEEPAKIFEKQLSDAKEENIKRDNERRDADNQDAQAAEKLFAANDALTESNRTEQVDHAKENRTSTPEVSKEEGADRKEEGGVHLGDDGENRGAETTGIKNRITDAERVAQGKEPITTARGIGKEDHFQKTSEKIKSGEITPQDIEDTRIALAKGLDAPSHITLTEAQDILIADRIALNKDYKEAITRLSEARKSGNENDIRVAELNMAAAESRIEENHLASKRSGTDLSEAFRARQNEINSDMSLDVLVERYKAASKDGTIPEDTRLKFSELTDKIESLDTKIEDVAKRGDAIRDEVRDLEEKLSKAYAEIEFLKQSKESGFSKRSRGYQKTKEGAQKLRTDARARLSAAAAEQRKTLSANPINAEMASALKDIVKSYVIEGVTEFAEIMDKTFQEAKEFIPDITMRQMRDAIFDYGKKRNLNPEEVATKMREVGREARLLSSYENVLNNELPERSGLQRDKPTPREKELKSLVMKEMRKRGLDVDARSEADKWASSLASYKTRLNSEIEALQNALDAGKIKEYYEGKKKEKTKLDDEANLLKKKRQELTSEAKNIIWEEERKNRPAYVKFLATYKNLKKQFLVSSVMTLETLTGAAWWRAALKLPNDLIGYGLSHTPGVKGFFKGSPSEYIGSRKDLASDLAQYYGTLLSKKTYSEGAKEALKSGTYPEEKLYGNDKDVIIPTGKIMKGIQKYLHTHGAIKYPIFKAYFDVATKRATEYMIRNGEDPLNPVTEAKIHALALEEGLRAVLKNDNEVVQIQRIMESYLRKKGHQGTAEVSGAFFPIVKISSNYFSESASHVPGVGLARASKGIYKAIAKGMESLTPEEKTHVARQLRMQGIGAGIALLGWYNYKQIAPFFGTVQRTDQTPEDGTFWGGNSHLFHNPAFDLMRSFATVRWVMDEINKKNSINEGNENYDKKSPVIEGIESAASGFMKQNPYIRGISDVFDGDIKQKAETIVKQAFIPPDVQKILKAYDVPGFENKRHNAFIELAKDRTTPSFKKTKQQQQIQEEWTDAKEAALKEAWDKAHEEDPENVPEYVPKKSEQKKKRKHTIGGSILN